MADIIKIYETLTARADAGGSQTTTPRGSTVSYMDTYSQTTYIGAAKSDNSMSYSITGEYAEVAEVDAFLRRILGSPFWFRFYDEEPERLWEVTDSWSFRHDAGLRWQLTATFKQATIYSPAVSDLDLFDFANKLNQVVNVILPSTTQ